MFRRATRHTERGVIITFAGMALPVRLGAELFAGVSARWRELHYPLGVFLCDSSATCTRCRAVRRLSLVDKAASSSGTFWGQAGCRRVSAIGRQQLACLLFFFFLPGVSLSLSCLLSVDVVRLCRLDTKFAVVGFAQFCFGVLAE